MSKYQRNTRNSSITSNGQYARPVVLVMCVIMGCCISEAASAKPPSDPVVEIKNRAREAAEQMREGDALLKAGDIAGACSAYAATLERLPSWWLPHLALVRCGRLLGRPASSLLHHARFAAEARPRIPATHLQLGLTLEELGQRDAAMAAYEAALKLRQDFFQARYRLGLLHREKGNSVDAIRHLNEVIKMYPGHMVALSLLAELHETKGHIDASLNTLKRMLLYSHHPRTVLSRIGRLLSHAGRSKELRDLKAEWRARFSRKHPDSRSSSGQ